MQAARNLGADDGRILAPCAAKRSQPVLVLASFEVARMILLESALGFLV